MRISDWSSDVCSSDLVGQALDGLAEALVVLDTDRPAVRDVAGGDRDDPGLVLHDLQRSAPLRLPGQPPPSLPVLVRSEEHTSELQSLMRISYAVFCLKKKKQQ